MNIVKLKWHGELPASQNMDELEHKVALDLTSVLDNVESPSKLIFHTVFVGKTMRDEIVTVWGEQDDDENFHCEYVENPEWVSLKQLEQEEKNNNANST